MISPGKHQQAPVEIKIAGQEGEHGVREARWLTPILSRTGDAGAELELTIATAQRTDFSLNLHGHRACTR
jgi:hypothetical protein